MMPSSAPPFNKPRRLVPHWAPMLFVAGFLVVIGVNATLIYFAQDTFSGLDTANPYERGLDYNKTLAAEAEQERLGWRAQTQVSGDSDGMRRLQVRMTDRDGHPLDSLTLAVHMVRPSDDGIDTTVVPLSIGDGRYVTTFVLPASGQWELRLVAQGNGVAWQHSERLFVK